MGICNWLTGGLLLLLSLTFGCSKQAWQQGFVAGQEYQCNKLAGRERSRCLEAIVTDFDRYQQERQRASD